MKFEIKYLKKGGYHLFRNFYQELIALGNIRLLKENYKSSSCCWQDENYFDYHRIQKTLCGKRYPDHFTPKRILVIQMI